MAKRPSRVPQLGVGIPDLRAVKLGVDNNRMTALVAALLDHAGGSVTLTKEESERIWNSPKLKYVRTPEGGLSLALEDYTPTHQPEEYDCPDCGNRHRVDRPCP